MPRISSDASLVNQLGAERMPVSSSRPQSWMIGRCGPKRSMSAAAKAGTNARDANRPIEPMACMMR